MILLGIDFLKIHPGLCSWSFCAILLGLSWISENCQSLLYRYSFSSIFISSPSGIQLCMWYLLKFSCSFECSSHPAYLRLVTRFFNVLEDYDHLLVMSFSLSSCSLDFCSFIFTLRVLVVFFSLYQLLSAAYLLLVLLVFWVFLWPYMGRSTPHFLLPLVAELLS